MTEQEKVKKFWNNPEQDGYAHRKYNYKNVRLIENDNSLTSSAKRHYDEWISKINWIDKTVVDYGIGGGYLGKLLFIMEDIKKYIGIDISERSIEKAKEILQDWNTEFYEPPVDFSLLNADIFVSMACIQHFPSYDYLVNFLQNINNSNVPVVMLQIRWGDETEFNNAYEYGKGVGKACKTNFFFVSNILTNYTLIHEGEVHESRYQYLIYQTS